MANVANLIALATTLDAGATDVYNQVGIRHRNVVNPFNSAGWTVAQPRILLPFPTIDDVSPLDDATGIPAGWATWLVGDPGLNWSATDATVYDVYFGTVDPPPLVSTGQSGTRWVPSGELAYSTTYYWKIVAKNIDRETIGPVWSFTTGAPTAPFVPQITSPYSGTINAPLATELDWQVTPGADTYDVMWGVNGAALTEIATDIVESEFDPPPLDYDSVYQWQIIAKNAVGETPGAVWHFWTGPTPPPESAPPLSVLINEEEWSTEVKEASINIRDAQAFEVPNTCSFYTYDPPDEGSFIVVSLGPWRIFAGSVVDVSQTWEEIKANNLWFVSCKGPTRLMEKRRPFGSFENTPADQVVKWLVQNWTEGFTTNHVEENLQPISITFEGLETVPQCLTRVKQMTGATGYVDYDYDVYFFVNELEDLLPPEPLDNNSTYLTTLPPPTRRIDLSQVRTRVFVKGYGTSVPIDIPAIWPLAFIPLPTGEDVKFSLTGGLAISKHIRMQYGIVRAGAAGARVGSSNKPTTAPSTNPTVGTGLSSGVYGYAQTWVTAAGETTPSPTQFITVSDQPVAPPTIPPEVEWDPYGPLRPIGIGPHWMDPNADYRYGYTFRAGAAETTISPITEITTTDSSAGSGDPPISLRMRIHRGIRISQPPPGFDIQFYRSEGDETTLYRMTGPSDGCALDTPDFYHDAYSPDTEDDTPFLSEGSKALLYYLDTSKVPPATNDSILARVKVGSLAVGPTGTTARRIYRTEPDGSQLKLLVEIPNNLAGQEYNDVGTAVLGANVPTSNTSGLVLETEGVIDAGSTTIPVTDINKFAPSSEGGIARIGTQYVKYGSATNDLLTGIPASGFGSLQNQINLGDEIENMPVLIGVEKIGGGQIEGALKAGDPINIFVQVDDVPAQTALGLLERDKDGNPTDGIREYMISDERIREDTAISWGQADLSLFKQAIVSIEYVTRDVKTRSGKTVEIDLPAPTSWVGALTIQDVSISEIDISPGLWPKFTVSAGSIKFDLEDLLRRAKLLTGGQ